MPNTLVDEMYAQAPEYVMNILVRQSTTVVQVESMKRPGLRKADVIYLADMPAMEERDEYLRQKLVDLVEKVKSEA